MRIQRGGQALRLAAGTAAIMIAAAACGSSSRRPAPSPTAGPALDAGRVARRLVRRRRARRRRPRGRSTCSTPPTSPRRARTAARSIIGDWQEANAVQPVLPDPGHRGERRLGDVVDARRVHQRLQVRARPRQGDPDARQRRRQGPGRQRRRDDRDLDPPRRPQVVRRPGPDLRRLQVRLGVGARPRQRGRRHRRASTTSRRGTARPRPRWSCTSRTSSRATSRWWSPRCRATTCPRSRSRTRSTAPASGRTRSRSCRPAARSSSSP